MGESFETGKAHNTTESLSCKKCGPGFRPQLTADTPNSAGSLRAWLLGGKLREILPIFLGSALFAAALLLPGKNLPQALFLSAYALAGWEVLRTAGKNLRKGKVFDENLLMLIASAGAISIGEYPEAAGVMLFYRVGEYLQERAAASSKQSIRALLQLKPDYANAETGEEVRRVAPETVRTGEIIVVKPGEQVPLDGKVVTGTSFLDTSSLTGETLPREVSPGEKILSGSINRESMLRVRVTRPFEESTVSRILRMVSDAAEKKAKTEKFISTFAKYYTPAVVAAAALIATIPPLLLTGTLQREWIYRALVFLVISCPCALVLSIPLAYFGGIGAASKRGILMKGGTVLDRLTMVKRIIFDKTGTLTTGKFSVSSVIPAEATDKEELLRCAAYSEYHSTHPVAEAIKAGYTGKLEPRRITSHRELSGYGVQALVEGHEIRAGNAKLLAPFQIKVPMVAGEGVPVYVLRDRKFMGTIVVEDTVRPNSAAAIKALRELGVREFVMLTGDRPAPARKIAEQLGLDSFHAALLPEDKLQLLRKLLVPGEVTAAVGDGMNDAPLLAGADLGIAMGGVGSDAAVEAAEVVLMKDDPMKVAESIRLARRTKRTVWQNIAIALGVKALVMVLGALGMAAMYQAVFADVGVALIAVANAARLIRGS